MFIRNGLIANISIRGLLDWLHCIVPNMCHSNVTGWITITSSTWNKMPLGNNSPDYPSFTVTSWWDRSKSSRLFLSLSWSNRVCSVSTSLASISVVSNKRSNMFISTVPFLCGDDLALGGTLCGFWGSARVWGLAGEKKGCGWSVEPIKHNKTNSEWMWMRTAKQQGFCDSWKCRRKNLEPTGPGSMGSNHHLPAKEQFQNVNMCDGQEFDVWNHTYIYIYMCVCVRKYDVQLNKRTICTHMRIHISIYLTCYQTNSNQ